MPRKEAVSGENRRFVQILKWSLRQVTSVARDYDRYRAWSLACLSEALRTSILDSGTGRLGATRSATAGLFGGENSIGCVRSRVTRASATLGLVYAANASGSGHVARSEMLHNWIRISRGTDVCCGRHSGAGRP